MRDWILFFRKKLQSPGFPLSLRLSETFVGKNHCALLFVLRGLCGKKYDLWPYEQQRRPTNSPLYF
jgi:hypothetical protein